MTIGFRFDLPPERALNFFRKKGLQTSFAWQDMMREEHDAAFTVAKMMDMDLLRDVRDAVDQAIAKGTSLEDFRAQMEPMLTERGWWGKKEMTDPLTGKTRLVQLGSPRRLETIYQTNLRAAYSAGHWSAILDNAEEAPFLMYDAVDDSRTRPEHAAWDGTVLPVNHEWWRVHYPPNGWKCRCSVIQLSRGQAQRLLKKDGPDRAPPTKTREWVNPRTGEVERVPVGIDPGWNYHPGMDRLPALQQQFREKAKSAGDLGERALNAAGLEP
jgi:SPP1 gp7 family putative phage head morphogenesis protein